MLVSKIGLSHFFVGGVVCPMVSAIDSIMRGLGIGSGYWVWVLFFVLGQDTLLLVLLSTQECQ